MSADELQSLLIPLSGACLLVPRSCVTEVIRFSEPGQCAGTTNWMLGSISWHGRDIPLVAFEGAIGDEVPKITDRTRIVVLYACSGRIESGHLGIVTQGFPQLARVNRDALQLDSVEGWPQEAPILCRVKLHDVAAVRCAMA
jgi:chemosensory pili system protein ChpC